jgi:hypothetical protein
MIDEILPCKKHGIAPSWRDKPIQPYEMQNLLRQGVREKELYCTQCEFEAQLVEKEPAINNWNNRNRK